MSHSFGRTSGVITYKGSFNEVLHDLLILMIVYAKQQFDGSFDAHIRR